MIRKKYKKYTLKLHIQYLKFKYLNPLFKLYIIIFVCIFEIIPLTLLSLYLNLFFDLSILFILPFIPVAIMILSIFVEIIKYLTIEQEYRYVTGLYKKEYLDNLFKLINKL